MIHTLQPGSAAEMAAARVRGAASCHSWNRPAALTRNRASRCPGFSFPLVKPSSTCCALLPTCCCNTQSQAVTRFRVDVLPPMALPSSGTAIMQRGSIATNASRQGRMSNSGSLSSGTPSTIAITVSHKQGSNKQAAQGSASSYTQQQQQQQQPSVAVAATTAVMTAPVQSDDVVIIGGEDDCSDADAVTANNVVPSPNFGVLRRNRALVLDSAYRPINVVNWNKAVMMDVGERADVLEYFPETEFAVSGRGKHRLPAVVRVHMYVDLHELCQRVSCTRRNVMARDKFSCCYCGAKRELTLDHVTPISRGGKDTWDNLVTACMPCNQRKGSKTLQQLGWQLKTSPREPKPFEVGVVVGLSATDIERPPAEWEPWIAHYRDKFMALKAAASAAGLESDSENDQDGDAQKR